MSCVDQLVPQAPAEGANNQLLPPVVVQAVDSGAGQQQLRIVRGGHDHQHVRHALHGKQRRLQHLQLRRGELPRVRVRRFIQGRHQHQPARRVHLVAVRIAEAPSPTLEAPPREQLVGRIPCVDERAVDAVAAQGQQVRVAPHVAEIVEAGFHRIEQLPRCAIQLARSGQTACVVVEAHRLAGRAEHGEQRRHQHDPAHSGQVVHRVPPQGPW